MGGSDFKQIRGSSVKSLFLLLLVLKYLQLKIILMIPWYVLNPSDHYKEEVGVGWEMQAQAGGHLSVFQTPSRLPFVPGVGTFRHLFSLSEFAQG